MQATLGGPRSDLLCSRVLRSIQQSSVRAREVARLILEYLLTDSTDAAFDSAEILAVSSSERATAQLRERVRMLWWHSGGHVLDLAVEDDERVYGYAGPLAMTLDHTPPAQIDVNRVMRSILVDWLWCVARHGSTITPPSTVVRAVEILDRVLEFHVVPRTELQLLGCVCFWLAALLDGCTQNRASADWWSDMSAHAFTPARFAGLAVELLNSSLFRSAVLATLPRTMDLSTEPGAPAYLRFTVIFWTARREQRSLRGRLALHRQTETAWRSPRDLVSGVWPALCERGIHRLRETGHTLHALTTDRL